MYVVNIITLTINSVWSDAAVSVEEMELFMILFKHSMNLQELQYNNNYTLK